MKVFKIIFVLCTMYYVLWAPTVTHAESTKPFPPFSIEGNPEEKIFFDDFFPLFRYIRFRALKIYENRDVSRNYDPYEKCSGGDGRDYACAIDAESGELVDGCDGGPVDICTQEDQTFVYTAESGPNNSCSAKSGGDPNAKGIIRGKCSYKKTPSQDRKIKGNDFSGNTLTYPKLQNEANAFDYSGILNNPISAGAHNLSLSNADQIILRLLVVSRAKQTKATLNETGQWPLGWVDWGYQVAIDSDLDPMTPKTTKTLLEIHDELPGGISGGGMAIAEAEDDFFLTGGNIEIVSDVSETKASIVKKVTEELSKPLPAQWAIDLSQAPLYPPSFRQGYTRPSICKWNWCCPGLRCPIPNELLIGTRRGLYYDVSVSRAYNAALYELFTTHSLDDSVKIFKKLVVTNPLIRFASSAAPQATANEIFLRLDAELGETCVKYTPWGNFLAFGTHIDYLDPDNFLGPNDTCPDYKLQPQKEKDLGGAYSETSLSWLMKLIWGGDTDEVDPIKYHLITIPDAMGQSITEIQQNFYDTRDTLAELESVKEFNENLNSTVDDDTSEKLYGKSFGPADGRRRLAYYTCDDPMYSSQLDTSIEAYALGTRVGCDGASSGAVTGPTTGKCMPDQFASIISDSPWKTVPSNVTSIVMNSAMFEDGVLNPKLEEVYAKVAEETGVPCEVLAGHHFEEASSYFNTLGSPETRSVANGNPANEQGGLKATALSAAKGLLRHPISNTEKLITAMSNFNGGGNSNCQIGFPTPIPYNNCPRQFQGEDDPYAMHMVDASHNNMYQLYCGDSLPCIPPVKYDSMRPGAFPVALVVHEYLKTRTPSTSPSPGASSAPGASAAPGGSGVSPFFPQTCGDGALDTALGCIPYAYQPFIVALLRFLIGISGAISLVVMLSGVIQIMTAAGDAKKIQSGRDLFFGATSGLLFLIFSVSILRIIAADILKLVGF